MAIASKPEMLRSPTEETARTNGAPSKNPAYSNGLCQLCQARDEPGALADVEYSRGSSVKVPKPGTNGQAYLTKSTLDYTSSFSKDKTMVNSSNPEMQQSTVEETVCTSGVPSKSPTNSNGFRQQLYQTEDESGYTDRRSTGSSEKLRRPGINGHDYPSASIGFRQQLYQTEDEAGSTDRRSSTENSEKLRKPDTNGHTYPSASIGFRQQLYQTECELGSTDRRSSTGSSEKLRMPGINGHAYPSASIGFRQQLYQTEDEPGSLTVLESSTHSSEKMPKPSTNGQAYRTKPTLDDTLKRAIYEKTLVIADSISKFISNKNRAVSTENPIIPSVRNYNGNSFSKTASNGIIESSLSEETESNGKFPFVLESDKSRDAEKVKSSLPATNGINDLFNNNDILPVAFPEFPFNIPASEIDDAPIIATKNVKIPHFQQYCEKSTHSVLLKREALSGGGVISNPSTPCTSFYSNFNTSPVSLPKTNSTELSKRSYQNIKPPILIDMNSKKSLPEFLLILENWGRKGLDKAFNRSIVDVRTHFTNDLHYGLDLMKQIITRICTLMTAAKHLPDPDLWRFVRGKNRVRGDLISTGITVWLTINDLELSVIQTINKMATNSGNITTDLYKKVTDNLSLLSKGIEDFQNKIHVFCSEIEKLM